MTQAEYVKHSGLSKGQVSKLVAKGMPLTSAAAADAWRGSTARRLPASTTTPPPTPATPTQGDGPYRPPEATAPPDPKAVTADTPHGAYERQRNIERASYALAVQALKAGANDAAAKVKTHANAVRSLLAIRQEVLDLEERERTLVPGAWVQQAMTRHDGAVATLLRAMPKQLAPRISPHDPAHAEQELERWVQDVCLKTLHETDPWKE